LSIRRNEDSTPGGAMFSLHAGPTRRELLHAGALSLLGLSATDLARLRAAPASSAIVERRRRNACVFLFLFGGPSHIDLWDMKPAAPPEVRGEFKPTATRVPGIRVCEHLPLLGRAMDKVCLLRSMTHRMNVHGPACSEVFSGRPYQAAPTTDEASREDWPSLSALVQRHGRWRDGLPPSVVLPWHLQFPGQSGRIAGQTGGSLRRACRWSRSTGRTRRRSTASTPAGTRIRTHSPSSRRSSARSSTGPSRPSWRSCTSAVCWRRRWWSRRASSAGRRRWAS